MIKLVGLKNCDTCRKAKKWLDAAGVEYVYHDVRADGLAPSDLEKWADVLGWEKLLNKRGTTWRTLDESVKADVDQAKAVELMAEHPTLMKRQTLLSLESPADGTSQPKKTLRLFENVQ